MATPFRAGEMEWLSGLEYIKHCSFSIELSRTFILLINVKVPTIVSIEEFADLIHGSGTFFHFLAVTYDGMSTG